jgi:hypothetical protein
MHRFTLVCTVLVVLSGTLACKKPLPDDPGSDDSCRPAEPGQALTDLYVSGFFTSSVQRFAGPGADSPGAPRPAPGQELAFYARPVSRRPWGLAFGPGGDFLYVANQQGSFGGAVARVHGPSSETPGAPAPGPGLPDSAFIADTQGTALSLVFGADGLLYVGSAGPVRRFDATTGALLGDFTSGRIPVEVGGLTFGPDGHLYVSSYNSCAPGPECRGEAGEVLRFDGQTGTFLDVFVANGTGGLSHPQGLAWLGGNLLVADAGAGVLRFAGPARSSPGAPLPAEGREGALFAWREGLAALQLAIGPDCNVYVSGSDSSGSGGGVVRFDGRSGADLGDFVSVEGGPRGLTFQPHPE